MGEEGIVGYLCVYVVGENVRSRCKYADGAAIFPELGLGTYEEYINYHLFTTLSSIFLSGGSAAVRSMNLR